jgi:ribosomal protein S18 acetylase RimI-like enzyme
MEIEFRLGREADTELIVGYVLQAGDGLFESLLDGVVPGVGAKQFLRLAVKDEASPLNYGNAILAEGENQVVGFALSYPATLYGMHPVLQSLLPRARLDPLAALFESKVADSWYLNSLVVADAFRGKGLARLLVGCCGDLALEAGQRQLSLHVWSDNSAAIGLYRDLGFSEVERVQVSLRDEGSRAGEMILMRAGLPLQ